MEPDWSYEDYQRMHELEAECSRLKRAAEELTATLEQIRGQAREAEKRLLDLEAEHFTDRLERDIDLETWDGIYAARVGHDLEEVADKLMDAIEADMRGEDIRGALFNIHGNVCSIIADMQTAEG